MDEESKNGQDNLISDMGKVQDALAKVLPPYTKYYVDAKKNESLSESFGSAVFSYEDTHISKLPLHHLTSSSTGNCLTYSSSPVPRVHNSFTLQSAGEDCDAKHMPLCFREVGASDLSYINDQCSNCDDWTVFPTCSKWEKLEDYYEEGDPFKVTGVEICTDICGPRVWKYQDYCYVSYLQISFQ